MAGVTPRFNVMTSNGWRLATRRETKDARPLNDWYVARHLGGKSLIASYWQTKVCRHAVIDVDNGAKHFRASVITQNRPLKIT